MRITMKAAIQFAAAVRVLAPAAAVTVFAQPSGPGISKEIGHMRLFVEPLFFSAV
jgi:ABC-type transporter Mla maintaining outer membrane lipid asymmetry permease subunit MlaE